MSLIIRLIILFPLIAFMSFENFSYDTNSSGSAKVIGRGVVKYVVPGGTREIISHWGYTLKNPEWEISPKDTKTFVYLEPDSIAKKYVDQLVYVEGTQYKIPGRKINSYTSDAPYDIIVIDNIYRIK